MECSCSKFLSVRQSAKISMASPLGSDRDNKFSLRCEWTPPMWRWRERSSCRRTIVSLRKTNTWLRAPFGRLALFRTWHVPHIVQAMIRWSEALGMRWLVIPIAPESRSRMQHGQCWIVAAETPPPARELNLPQGKASITASEGQKDRDKEEKPRTARERLDREGQTTSSTPDSWFDLPLEGDNAGRSLTVGELSNRAV